jgi:hypothetical protein
VSAHVRARKARSAAGSLVLDRRQLGAVEVGLGAVEVGLGDDLVESLVRFLLGGMLPADLDGMRRP